MNAPCKAPLTPDTRPAAAPARGPRIGYLPFGGITNAYAARFVDLLGEFGTVCALPQLRSVLTHPGALRRRYDLAVVNWVEFDLVRRRDGSFSLAGFVKVLARLLFYKRIARRLAYVRHNHFPHGTRERDVARARRALDFVERLADVVLIHSGHDLGARREYVPHPLYRPAAAALTEAEAALLATLPTDFYTVFGRIERYKRIERLIEHFPRERGLLVFGAAEDPAYAAALQRGAGPNVRVLAGYVSDALAQAVIGRSRGMVLAHAEPDMIVSGSLFYALSIGARVFAVDSPALAWIGRRIGGDSLHTAADIPALCALVARDRGAAGVPAQRPPQVEAEFGDQRIKAALREVLFR